jgi:hypothetical protein
MPHEFQQAAGHMRLTMSGVITKDELMLVAKEAAEIEAAARVTPHRLTDLAQVADFDLDFSRMHDFASLRRAAPLRNKVRSALVAPSQLQFGFARMFQTLNDNPLIEIAVFREETEALAWLREGSTVA